MPNFLPQTKEIISCVLRKEINLVKSIELFTVLFFLPFCINSWPSGGFAWNWLVSLPLGLKSGLLGGGQSGPVRRLFLQHLRCTMGRASRRKLDLMNLQSHSTSCREFATAHSSQLTAHKFCLSPDISKLGHVTRVWFCRLSLARHVFGCAFCGSFCRDVSCASACRLISQS